MPVADRQNDGAATPLRITPTIFVALVFGLLLAVLVGIGNISMPLAVFFGMIGGDVPRV